MYVRAQQDPQIFEYTQELCRPVSTERVNGGVLYDFGRELTADTLIKINGEERPDQVTLCYGESRTEALDTQLCYLKQVLEIPGKRTVYRRAVPAGLKERRTVELPRSGAGSPGSAIIPSSGLSVIFLYRRGKTLRWLRWKRCINMWISRKEAAFPVVTG